MKKNFLKKIVICTCFLMIFCSATVFATTFMSYEGWGIYRKDSVQTFSLSRQTVIYIQHTTVNWDDGVNSNVMTIKVKKKNGLGYYAETGQNFSVRGVRSLTDYWTLEPGTYRLGFQSDGATAHIKGQVID